jgi:hypothetical protein
VIKKKPRDLRPRKSAGEGPVKYTLPESPNGPLNIGIDFSLAPVPAAYFYADSVSLKRDSELAMVILSFGRFDLTANRLTERIEIAMPQVALFAQFWHSVRNVEDTVNQQLRALKLPAASRSITTRSRARATLYANAISVSVGNGESCLDFYYMSVRDIHLVKIRRISEIGLEPIIRILCSPAVLKSLFDLCRPYATEQAQLFEGSDRASAS